jgi:hypothetical protein
VNYELHGRRQGNHARGNRRHANPNAVVATDNSTACRDTPEGKHRAVWQGFTVHRTEGTMTATIAWTDLTDYGRERMVAYFDRKRQAAWEAADVSKARVYYADSVSEFDTDQMAYAVWLGMGKGVRCAFRGIGDTRPVYTWDLVDRG